MSELAGKIMDGRLPMTVVNEHLSEGMCRPFTPEEEAPEAKAPTLAVLNIHVQKMDEQEKKGGNTMEQEKSYPSFAMAARELRAGRIGKYQIGDKLATQHDNYGVIEWLVIGRHEDRNTITVQMCNPPLWRCFDTPCKEWPFGLAVWDVSDIRRWLQDWDFKEDFTQEDISAIRLVTKRTYDPRVNEYVETKDTFFLLSASEAGYEVDGKRVLDEGEAYEYYATDGMKRRQMRDIDGDECHVWLRSPHPSLAYYVRLVIPSGALSVSGALNGNGLAAACEIG